LLGHVEPLRCPTKMQFFCYRYKIAQMPQFHLNL
jgi:hypothetical protein